MIDAPHDTDMLNGQMEALALSPSSPLCVFPSVCRVAPDGYLFLVDEIGHRIIKYDAEGNFVASFGGYGSETGSFVYPTDAVIHNGCIYITDRWNHRLQVFGVDDCQFRFVIGHAGNSHGELLEPYGVAVFDGMLVVAERENERLSFFTLDGQFVRCASFLMGSAAPITYPTSLAVAGDYLIVLTAGGVLIVNKLFERENLIVFDAGDGAPIGLYPFGDRAFMISSDSGCLSLYGIEGGKRWTRKSSSSRGLKKQDDTVAALCGSLRDKTFSIFHIPYEVEYPQSIESDSESVFFRKIISKSPRADISWPKECIEEIPSSFRTACFYEALSSFHDQPEAFRGLLLKYIVNFPTTHHYHKAVLSNTSLPDDLREYAKNNAVHIKEIHPIRFSPTDAALDGAVGRSSGGDFFASRYLQGGMLRMGGGGQKILSETKPVNCRFIWPLSNNDFLIQRVTEDKILIERLKNTMHSKEVLFESPHPEVSPLINLLPTPFLVGETHLLYPNMITGYLDRIDIQNGQTAPMGNDAPLRFSQPISVAVVGPITYVLQMDQRLISINNETNSIQSVNIHQPLSDYVAMQITPSSDGTLFALCCKPLILSDGRIARGPNLVAKIDPYTGATIFAFNTFNISPFEMGAFSAIFSIFSEPNGDFWVFDVIDMRLIRFTTGKNALR